MSITRKNVLTALQRAVELTPKQDSGIIPDGGFTAKEYAEKTGLKLRTALIKLEAMVEAKQLKKGKFTYNGHKTNYYTNP